MRTLEKLRYLRPALGRIKWLIAAMGALTFLMSLFSLAPPYLTKLLFDRGIMVGEVGRIAYYGILAIVAYLLIAGGGSSLLKHCSPWAAPASRYR